MNKWWYHGGTMNINGSIVLEKSIEKQAVPVAQ